MSVRLILLCAGGTASARVGGFADPDEPLDDGGRAKAGAVVIDGPVPSRCFVSPGRAAVETAELIGLDAVVEPALADIDHGDWRGKGFAEIEPAGLMRWLAAPEAGAPGGETLADVVARVAPWLDGLCDADGTVLAVTHAMVVRAVLVHSIGLPAAAAMAIDVGPLSQTVLSSNGRWRLQGLREG
ncbi:histidine phosphatase family protein [Sphingomonas prati]|uniref:Broad specificity phosphatase PhoE n=1 Tax=Sphingomonas prati TaxID=1843237 RepID=A0A7W9F0X5_9SPHN|nr:histidine phosphatase family protein [Sphingomonas prati]MBB5728703.1 broad specificity phosphatase PhoE [Sphingomonas prati]GGE71759.1 phosphoglycerate mutase [Sphingomonas prati]